MRPAYRVAPRGTHRWTLLIRPFSAWPPPALREADAAELRAAERGRPAFEPHGRAQRLRLLLRSVWSLAWLCGLVGRTDAS